MHNMHSNKLSDSKRRTGAEVDACITCIVISSVTATKLLSTVWCPELVFKCSHMVCAFDVLFCPCIDMQNRGNSGRMLVISFMSVFLLRRYC
jgi:hypothetical protein